MIKDLPKKWDMIIIGGGITGAGVFQEACRQGFRCLLAEQRDFGWGTSSRSGKLVHGGLRYLRQGQFKTTIHSVREREKLLHKYRGMVEPLGFLLPVYNSRLSQSLLLKLGLVIYDCMALRWQHTYYDAGSLSLLAPGLKANRLAGGFSFTDARTDDARLVYRTIEEGIAWGGTACNYAPVKELLKDTHGRVRGVAIYDERNQSVTELESQVVINATGVWVDELNEKMNQPPRLRKLRGSHIIFPHWRLPLAQAVSMTHPRDGRSLYVMPWEGVTLLGTTDIDHEHPLSEEPAISRSESNYLLEAIQSYFPSKQLSEHDVLSTFSGVRPILDSGKADPSKESRDHLVWSDRGVVSVTGGKLTTFHLLARETLQEARKWINTPSAGKSSQDAEIKNLFDKGVQVKVPERLRGRHGEQSIAMLQSTSPEELQSVPGTDTCWLELRWALRHEMVVHLDDLLLRRTRLGLLLPDGARMLKDQVRQIVQTELGWADQKWETEWTRYLSIWERAYSATPYLYF
ncbi:glycerol-3-phosphate dehydrogenase/oxidase [Brevibacillus sp. SYSU BS000544]|uniref:glycerol-3-phosphate dehydrogenase/oxidase n=1 Tax=Brevibacillus sp. SYSU BS000544 TaxID=3416443 RepID=UPI003CE5348B